MTIEAGVVLDNNNKPLHWHLPPGRSVGGLPDSRDLWEVIWENRDNLSGIAHSHPGTGKPGPSHTDVTTFAAVEAALGRRLDWWIVSAGDGALVLLRHACIAKGAAAGKYEYQEARGLMAEYPTWIPRLCELSQT